MGSDPSAEPVVVAVDISSSGLRCTAHRRDLSIVDSESEELATTALADGTSTQSWADISAALDEGLAHIGRRHANISAIVLSGTASNFTVADRSDGAAAGSTPAEALLWSDHRASPFQAEASAFAAVSGSFRRTLCPDNVSYWPAKLRWAMAAADASTRRALFFAGVKDLSFARLTGRQWTDPMTAAATGVFDSEQFCWDGPLLAAAGATDGQLPQVRPATASAPILPTVADRLGLSPSTAVVVGGMDGPLAQLGAAGLQTAVGSCTIGTTLAFRMGSSDRLVDRQQRVWCYPVLDNFWVSGGAGSNGGNVLTWLADVTGRTGRLSELVAAAFEVQLDPDVLFVPYLNGERAPLWDNSLRASIIGLAAHHTAVDIARAALDGVAAAAIELATAVKDLAGQPQEVRLTGGFLGSASWAQLMTDALGVPTCIPQPEAATSVGAAMIAWLAVDPTSCIATPPAMDHRTPSPDIYTLLTAKAARTHAFRHWLTPN